MHVLPRPQLPDPFIDAPRAAPPRALAPPAADTLIEQLAQKKVSEIFAEEGEAAFRELETQVLAVSAGVGSCAAIPGGVLL